MKLHNTIREITRRQCFAWLNSQTHTELEIVRKHLDTLMAEKGKKVSSG